jgi:hypothetical protein
LILKPLLGLVFNSQKCDNTFVTWYKGEGLGANSTFGGMVFAQNQNPKVELRRNSTLGFWFVWVNCCKIN